MPSILTRKAGIQGKLTGEKLTMNKQLYKQGTLLGRELMLLGDNYPHLVNITLTIFVPGYLFKDVCVVKIDGLSPGLICLLTNMIKIIWCLSPLGKDGAWLLVVHLKGADFLNLEFLNSDTSSLWAESAKFCLCISIMRYQAEGELMWTGSLPCLLCPEWENPLSDVGVSGLLPASMKLHHANLLAHKEGNSRPFTILANTSVPVWLLWMCFNRRRI